MIGLINSLFFINEINFFSSFYSPFTRFWEISAGSTIYFLTKSVKINPNFSNSHNNIGIALQRLGDLDGAVKSYQTALKLKPDFAEAHNNIGLVFQKKDQI